MVKSLWSEVALRKRLELMFTKKFRLKFELKFCLIISAGLCQTSSLSVQDTGLFLMARNMS